MTPVDAPCLAVVMPCYNEARTIEQALDRVLASPLTAEVIVVNDGSDDGTDKILHAFTDRRVRVIDQGINLGKGAAIRRGFLEVTAPYVIVQDADLEYDPADYQTMVQPLIDGRADVVFGSRFSPRPHRVLYFWHTVANKGITLLSNAVTNLNLTDASTGFKAFRREVIESLELDQDRFGVELEITAKAATGGWRVYEVGISYDGRTYAEGKKVRWTDAPKGLYCIARYSRPGMRICRPRLHAPQLTGTVEYDELDNELADSLDNLDNAENYADWITDMIAPYAKGEIVEIGAGHGTMSERLSQLGHVTASEPSERAAERLRTRFAGNPKVTVEQGTADEVMAPEQFDTAVLINVLEHIPDDVAALKDIYRGLRRGGTVAIFVPAHEALYSEFDHQIGHQRRYRRSTLAGALTQAGFEIDELRYVNLPGLLAWFLVARLGRRTPTESQLAVLFDRYFVPVLKRAENHWVMPTGVSLLAIGRRPDA